jgi:hypothetical protein
MGIWGHWHLKWLVLNSTTITAQFTVLYCDALITPNWKCIFCKWISLPQWLSWWAHPTCIIALEMVITYTLTFTFGHTWDAWAHHQKLVVYSHGPALVFSRWGGRAVRQPMYIITKKLSKLRCRCEQLDIRPWWCPQLFHIRKSTESWCDQGMSWPLSKWLTSAGQPLQFLLW